MRACRLRSLRCVVSHESEHQSKTLGLAKLNCAVTRRSQASGCCASIDVVSLLAMPPLAGNPLDWFLLECAARWLVGCGIFFLQSQEAQLHRLEIVETRFSHFQRGFLRVCYAPDRRWVLFPLQSPSVQPRHPQELLADYSETSFAVTRSFQACINLASFTSIQIEYISNIVYLFLRNFQICQEPLIQIAGCSRPRLGALQDEGKSAVSRSSRADTFSITCGQVRRIMMLPKLFFLTFCSGS